MPALENFVTGFAEQAGWQVIVDLSQDELHIPSQLEPTIFRLVQESLNNVAKHAEATQVQVSLAAIDEKRQLLLTIRDNGLGFYPNSGMNRGLGLQQMEARVTSIGGIILLDSSPDQGTIITAHLPVPGEVDG